MEKIEGFTFLYVVILLSIGRETYGQSGKDVMITDFEEKTAPFTDFEKQTAPFADFEKRNDSPTDFEEPSGPSTDFPDQQASIDSCSAIEMYPGDYTLREDGTVYIEAYNQTYNSSLYHLHDNGILTLCVSLDFLQGKNSTVEVDSNIRSHLVFYYLTRICLTISMVCLLLHLIVFYFVQELRNLPGYNMASLCVSLLLFYSLFMISDIDAIVSYEVSCKAIATVSYFFILSAFMWMVTMSFDVFRSLLKATGKLRLSSTRFAKKRYMFYCFFCWGLPLLFVITCSVLDNMDGVPYDYQPRFGKPLCWFGSRMALLIFFGGPVFTVIAINIVFFICSAYIIFVNRLKTEEIAYRMALRKKFVLHYRLATIMGLTWIMGVANTSSNFWLLSLYVLLSSLQGFFIFLACTCTAKVRRRVKELLKYRDRKISTISTTATFQSYCTQEFVTGGTIYKISTSNGSLEKV